MRRITLVALLAILSMNLFAQSTDRKGFVGITLGPAIPVGDFASKASSNNNAGFAKTGMNINLLNFGYRFGKNLGVTAFWFGASHEVDMSGVKAMWSYGAIMAGPMYTLPVGEKLELGLKGTIGSVAATLDIDQVGKSTGSGFGYDLGASLHYNYAERWCLLLNADYLGAKPKFTNATRKIAAISLSAGIAYRW